MDKWENVLKKLETGELRSAEKVEGKWVANTAVKEMILEAFKAGYLIESNGFVDKHNLYPKPSPKKKDTACSGGSLRPEPMLLQGLLSCLLLYKYWSLC